MTDIILAIVLTLGIRVMNDIYAPKHYLITYFNRQTEEVVMEKSGKYICPLYCDISHPHLVKMCDLGCKHAHNELVIHKDRGIADNLMTFKGQSIMTFEMIIKKGDIKGIQKLWAKNKKDS